MNVLGKVENDRTDSGQSCYPKFDEVLNRDAEECYEEVVGQSW